MFSLDFSSTDASIAAQIHRNLKTTQKSLCRHYLNYVELFSRYSGRRSENLWIWQSGKAYCIYLLKKGKQIVCVIHAQAGMIDLNHKIPQCKNSGFIVQLCPSCFESFRLLVWQAESTASRQGLSRDRSPVGYQFSELFFPDAPGTATEQVRTCGFSRNSSDLDKSTQNVWLRRAKFLGMFLVTCLSFASETWVMCYSAIPGLTVFSDWLFLVFLVFLLKFPLTFSYSSKLSRFWGTCSVNCEDCIIFYFVAKKCRSPLFWRIKVSTKESSLWCRI